MEIRFNNNVKLISPTSNSNNNGSKTFSFHGSFNLFDLGAMIAREQISDGVIDAQVSF